MIAAAAIAAATGAAAIAAAAVMAVAPGIAAAAVARIAAATSAAARVGGGKEEIGTVRTCEILSERRYREQYDRGGRRQKRISSRGDHDLYPFPHASMGKECHGGADGPLSATVSALSG
jgi:hypothetical protein